MYSAHIPAHANNVYTMMPTTGKPAEVPVIVNVDGTSWPGHYVTGPCVVRPVKGNASNIMLDYMRALWKQCDDWAGEPKRTAHTYVLIHHRSPPPIGARAPRVLIEDSLLLNDLVHCGEVRTEGDRVSLWVVKSYALKEQS